MNRRGEAGYAMIAVIVVAGIVAGLAIDAIASSRSSVVSMGAQAERARLSAAADAGFAIAVHGLGIADRTARWDIDGRPHRLDFNGIALTIAVDDERGKIPLNEIDEPQVRRMFEAAGAPAVAIDGLVDAFLDWRDDDDDRRPHGAEAADYAALGIVPANDAFSSVDELALLKGMTAAIMRAIAPAATVVSSNAVLDPRTAQPLALMVMDSGGVNGPAVIARQREQAGQRPALDIAPEINLTNRALTIRVAARSASGALTSSAQIELTGLADPSYVVRRLK